MLTMRSLLLPMLALVLATGCTTIAPSAPAPASATSEPFVVVVRTVHVGASAEWVESELTVPLERELVTVPQVVSVASVSRAEESVVEVYFANRAGAPEKAAVEQAVARAWKRMPAPVKQPAVGVEKPTLSQ
jgi:multidrug efflux pump